MAEVLQTANHVPRGVGLVSVQLHGPLDAAPPDFRQRYIYISLQTVHAVIMRFIISMSRYIHKVTFT